MRKRLTRRDFLKVSGGTLAGTYVLTLTGCGGGGTGGGGSVELYSDKSTGQPWKRVWTQMGDLAKKQIGIDLKLSGFSGTTTYQQALQSSLRTGESPDLFTWWSGYRLQDLAKQGVLTDLSSIWEEELANGNIKEELAPAVTFDGKRWGVPFANVSYWPFFYNTKVFDEQGLKPPETWDDFVSVADALKEANVTPFYATVDGRWPAFIWFEELLIRTDPDFYNRLVEEEESYTDPLVVGVMKEWKSLIDAGYFSDLDIPLDSNAAGEFAQGRIAMFPIGTWFNQTFVDAGMKPEEDYSAFILPNVDPNLKERLIVFETSPAAIPRNAPNPDASKQLAQWWVSAEAQKAYAEKLGDVPANPKVRPANPVVDKIVSTTKDQGYKLVQRYWEATPPQIVEEAVDQLARFMLNPSQYMDVLKTIEDIARSEWNKRK
jgi:multiple sugar transport system substrate-binding protein